MNEKNSSLLAPFFLFFVLFLAIPASANALDTSRCIDPQYEDFKLVGVRYLSCISSLELTIQTTWFKAVIWPEKSYAIVAGYYMPILPLVDKEFFAGENVTIFIPFKKVPGTAEIRIAGNASDQFICSTFAIDLDSIAEEDCSLLGFNVTSKYIPENAKIENSVINYESDIAEVFGAVFYNDTVSRVSSTVVEGGSTAIFSIEDVHPDMARTGEIYIYSSKNGKVFLKKFKNYKFYSFDTSFLERILTMPGTPTRISGVIKNTGTLLDCYSVRLYMPSGWEYQEISSFCLEPGEVKNISIAIVPPDEVLREETAILQVISQNSNLVKNASVVLYPQPYSEYEVTLVEPATNISAYKETEVLAYLLGSSTTTPLVAWVVTTSPAIRIDGGFGVVPLITGQINIVNSTFLPYTPCAISEMGEKAYNSARKLAAVIELVKKQIYDQRDIGGNIDSILESLKTNIMENTYSKQLILPKLTELEKIIERYRSCASDVCLEDLKEDVTFLSLDYPVILSKFASKAFEECTATRTVNLCISTFSSTDAEWREACKTVVISGEGAIGVEFPDEIRVISGSYKREYLVLTNYGDEKLEIKLSSDFEWLNTPKYVYLGPKSTKKVIVYIKIPEYFESDGEEYHIVAEGKGFSITKTFKLYAGILSLSASLPQDIIAIPGQTKEVPITISTGSLKEDFYLVVTGLPWVSVRPRRVTSENGSVEATLIINPPPKSGEGSYIGYLSIIPIHFESKAKKFKFTVIVSSEIEKIKERLKELKEELEKTTDIDEEMRTKIENYIKKAESAIGESRPSRAKYYLSLAEGLFNKAKQAETKSSNKGGSILGFLAIVLIVGGAVFLLPILKERGMLPEPLIPLAEKVESILKREGEETTGLPEEVRMIEGRRI